jgi:D-hydroxyproline dehydrogenase
MPLSPSPTSAIVIGGGVVGAACALRLQQRGVVTVLIDDAPANPHASWGNAGHIAAEQAEPIASRATIASVPRRLFLRGGPVAFPPRDTATWLPFGLRLLRATSPAKFARGAAALRSLMADALPAWRRLAADMGDAALVQDHGHFIVWETAPSASAGVAAWTRADTGSASFRLAQPHEVQSLRRFTKVPIAGAIRFAGTGQIVGHAQVADAQLRALKAAGGTTRTARATLRREGDSIVVVVDGETLRADVVVVAAGVASAGLLAPLGLRVPMIAERGYHIEGDTTGPALPPVVFEERSLIVGRFGDRLRASSFTEFSRADRPPDARKWARLERHAADLGLPFTGPRDPWCGSRPTLPDYLPAIGRGPGNLVAAFGHNHLGLTLAPVTAERVAALVVDGAPVDPAFALGRF